ncbi:unnamed protein product [Withania somnifera]
MSVSTKNPPNTLDGGSDNDEDDAVGDRNKEFGKKKGKRVSCFRFRKVKRTLLWRKRKGVSENSERRRELSGGGCYMCVKRPLTSDSGGEAPTSDPNSPNFTYDRLRLFIEKNDFYSNECNPHLDIDSKHQ